jgi:hypothetical protein
MKFMGMETISRRTYNRHQKEVLNVAVQNVWHRQQLGLLAALQEEFQDGPLDIGGDARHDSMGHSAKFGTYVTMEMSTKNIVDLQIIQVIYDMTGNIISMQDKN